MCLYPRLIDNPKYKANKKNGGQVPPVLDSRVKKVPIGCGKCLECMKQKSNHWKIRLYEDIQEHTNAKFVTLTFDPEPLKQLYNIVTTKNQKLEGYDIDNAIATLATRRFLERWRKQFKKSLRHWLVTEIGGTRYESLHLHGIVFTDNTEAITKHWHYGFTFVGKYVNSKTITYISKYLTKADAKHPNYTPVILTSAGIGRRYTEQTIGNWQLNKYKGEDTKDTYRTPAGIQLGLPIYYRNKIYTEEERERLWLHKLDKQERWVLGNKIDITNGEEAYWAALKWAQQKNIQLGYGGEPLTWEQEYYEKQLRELKIKEKIQKKNNNNKKKEIGRADGIYP